MKAVIQRVSEANVSIDEEIVGQIDSGFVILLGVAGDDETVDADYLVDKIVNLRVFDDDAGKMNCSLLEKNGEALVISQFTLYANTRKGRRPSFTDAAPPEKAVPLYEYFIQKIAERGIRVAKGVFGAMMSVKIHNAGPVTIILESKDRLKPRRA